MGHSHNGALRTNKEKRMRTLNTLPYSNLQNILLRWGSGGPQEEKKKRMYSILSCI